MSFHDLIVRNQQWSRKQVQKKSDFFQAQSHMVSPKILWIGCVDARVCPEHITQAKPGEILVYRNVANVFALDQQSNLTALEIAVNNFQVETIIVCGHTQCLGIKQVLVDAVDETNAYFQSAVEVKSHCEDALNELTNETLRWRYLAEQNALAQANTIRQSDVVKAALAQGREIQIQALLYNVETGLLEEIKASSDVPTSA